MYRFMLKTIRREYFRVIRPFIVVQHAGQPSEQRRQIPTPSIRALPLALTHTSIKFAFRPLII